MPDTSSNDILAAAPESTYEDFLAANANLGACPPPDLLFAASEDVLPQPAGDAIRAHLAFCLLCQTLLRGLAPAEVELTPGQDARIHGRLLEAIQPESPALVEPEKHPLRRMIGPLITVLLLAIGCVALFRFLHHLAETSPTR